MYEGFKRFEIQTTDPEVKIVGRVGGKGPAVLLLHGNPLTHVHWHLVAPRLAKDFTVSPNPPFPPLPKGGDMNMSGGFCHPRFVTGIEAWTF
ncbi:MAG TPA: hypothetical protein VGA12_11655 [Burkholderiales bacterium]|jgi:hypothetical protein